MIRIILFVALFSLAIHQIVLLPVNELSELQKEVDERVKVDGEDDYRMEEINKLAMRDESENTILERLKRQPESLEEKEKPTSPPKPQAAPAPIVEGSASGALSNLQLSFQKQFSLLGITLGILYKMNKY